MKVEQEQQHKSILELGCSVPTNQPHLATANCYFIRSLRNGKKTFSNKNQIQEFVESSFHTKTCRILLKSYRTATS